MPNKRTMKIGVIAASIIALFILLKIASSLWGPSDSLQILGTATVETGNLNITVVTTGEIKPYNRVEVRPPIAGRVEEILVREGESVRRGQILAWLSSTERATLLDAARIRGEEELKRWKDAYKAAPIIAPLDGTVIARSAEPGQTVANTNPIVVISDRLIAEARVDETDLSMIHLGQSAEIRLDAYPERVIAGTVDHINHESELLNNVNVYSINILPEEIPPMVRSGMTAHITFILDKRENVLLVPSESVAEWPQNMARPPGADFAVYTKRFAGKLQPLPVRIGQSDGRWTEIQEGLSEGMIVQIVRKKQTGATSPLAFRRPQQRDRPRQT